MAIYDNEIKKEIISKLQLIANKVSQKEEVKIKVIYDDKFEQFQFQVKTGDKYQIYLALAEMINNEYKRVIGINYRIEPRILSKSKEVMEKLKEGIFENCDMIIDMLKRFYKID